MTSSSQNHYEKYLTVFSGILENAAATDNSGAIVDMDGCVKQIGNAMRECHDRGNKIMLIGNGGSAGICSHMATDISKNGGMRATAFNDGSVLTCLSNDYGYEYVFQKQIEWHAAKGDILIAISSSGQSTNILNAVEEARSKGCIIYTLSGFRADNPLRAMGDLNVYLDSLEYGFVEVGHLAIIHAALDIKLGWGA